MRNTLAPTFLFLLLLSSNAKADIFYEFVHFKCDSKSDFVKIELLGAYNEAGEKLKKNLDKNTWDPWTLVRKGDSGRYIKNTKTIKKNCELSDGKYAIEISPNPCNGDTEGLNGGMMMTWAVVIKDEKELARESLGACVVDGDPIATKLTIQPGKKPKINRKPGTDYFTIK